MLRVSTFHINPDLQMVLGTWAFIGIPITISAGVAALYRVELPLRVFFMYHLVSFFFGVGIPIAFLASGSLCDTIVTPEVQRMGSSFVCGFTDTFTFFWTLMCGVIHAYMIYIVWSAAEEICEAPYPELMKYSDALRGVYMPDPPQDQQYTLGAPRGAAFAPGTMPPGMMGKSFGTFNGAPAPGMMPGPMGPMPGSF